MPINFPDFKDTRCIAIGVCGRLDTDDRQALEMIAAHPDPLVARYRTGKTTAYIRLYLGGTNPKHVHIDVYRREAFGRSVPKTTSTRKEIEQQLEVVRGKKIVATALGRYEVPSDEVPEGGLIKSASFDRRADTLVVKMISATFAIGGAPVSILDWQLVGEGQTYRVELSARVSPLIQDNYILDQLRLIDSGFGLFVIGDRPHVRD